MGESVLEVNKKQGFLPLSLSYLSFASEDVMEIHDEY